MVLVGVLVSIFSLMSFFEEHFFFTDFLVNFRFQFFWILLVCSAIEVFKRKFKLIVLFLPLALLNLYSVVPSWIEENTVQKPAFKIYFSNIYTGNHEHDHLIRSIKASQAEIVVLQEITEKWMNALNVLIEKYPYRVIRARENNFGIAVFSMFEIQDSEVFVGKAEVESIWIKIKIKDEVLHLVTTHPVPPVSPEFMKLRNYQYKEIQNYLEKLQGKKILIGDMNTVAWSSHIKRLSDKAKLKLVNTFYDTWNSSFPYGFRIRLDHAFISRELMGSIEVLEDVGSDHLPMLLSVRDNDE